MFVNFVIVNFPCFFVRLKLGTCEPRRLAFPFKIKWALLPLFRPVMSSRIDTMKPFFNVRN